MPRERVFLRYNQACALHQLFTFPIDNFFPFCVRPDPPGWRRVLQLVPTGAQRAKKEVLISGRGEAHGVLRQEWTLFMPYNNTSPR